MAITVTNSASGTYTAITDHDFNTVFNNNATVDTGIIVFLSADDSSGRILDTVTYDGDTLTKAGEIDCGATAQRLYIYYLANPSTGSNTLTINHLGTGVPYAEGAYGIIAVENLLQSASLSQVLSTTDTATTISQAITAANTNNLIVSIGKSNTGAHTLAITSPSGTTEVFNAVATGGWTGMDYLDGTTEIEYTFTYGDSDSNDKYLLLAEFERALEPPIVTTTPTYSLLYNSKALVAAEIDGDNGHTITERGIVYATTTSPTTADNKNVVAGTTGAFTSQMSGLDGATKYYIRAFATNAEGTSYSPEINITTLPDWIQQTTILA